MIILQIPFQKDYIIELFDNQTLNNQTFHFIKQDQMKIYFEVSGNQQQAVETVKSIIKESKIGNVMHFMVTYEK